MKFFRNFLMGSGAVIIVLFIIAAFFPSELKIQREIKIKASQKEVYQEIAILRNWTHWALSEDEIQAVNGQFEGNIEGEGAIYSWYLEDGVQNTMEITESKNDASVLLKTTTSAGYLASTDFQIQSEGDSTLVIWNEVSDLGWNPVNIIMISLVGAESQIGAKYQLALEKLKSYMEKD